MEDSLSSGASVTWNYNTEADSTFTVGISNSEYGGYSASGSYTISNSMGSSGGYVAPNDDNWYVDGHVYQGQWVSNRDPNQGNGPACGVWYMTHENTAVGDSYQGPNQPSLDPWGRCGYDPYGLATVQYPNGYFNSDRGQATVYSGVATFWNLQVGGSTGYTTGIHIRYDNHSAGDLYVCGTGYLPNAPALFENNSNGR